MILSIWVHTSHLYVFEWQSHMTSSRTGGPHSTHTNNSHRWISFDSSNIILPQFQFLISWASGKFSWIFFRLRSFGSLGFGEDDGRGVGEPLNETEYVSPYTVQDLDLFGWFGSPNVTEIGWMGHWTSSYWIIWRPWRTLTLIAKSLNLRWWMPLE